MSSRTIAHLYHERVQKSQAKPFVYYPQNGDFIPLSYNEAQTIAHEIGAGLWSLGVRKGERVVIVCQTRYEWTMADWATLALGGVVVAIYPNSTPEQIAFIMQHSEAKAAVLEDAEQWQKISGIRLGD